MLLNLIYNRVKKCFSDEFEDGCNCEWCLNDDDLGVKIGFVWNVT